MVNLIYSHKDYINEIRKIKTSMLLMYENDISDIFIDQTLRCLIKEMNIRYLREFQKRLQRKISMNDIRILLTKSYVVYIESIKIMISILKNENTDRHNAAHGLLMLNGNSLYNKIPMEFLLTHKLLYLISKCVSLNLS